MLEQNANASSYFNSKYNYIFMKQYNILDLNIRILLEAFYKEFYTFYKNFVVPNIVKTLKHNVNSYLKKWKYINNTTFIYLIPTIISDIQPPSYSV